MKTRLLWLLVVSLAVLASVRAQTTAPFPGTIILGRPTAQSIAVNILFDANQDAVYLEYGEQTGVLSQQTPQRSTVRASVPLEEVLTGLKANKRYYYRVRSRKLPQDPFSASPEYTFHTQRSPGSAFTFAIQGDSHPERASQFDSDLYSRTLRTVAADQPDFFMTIGDDFSVDTLRTVNATTVAQRYTLQLPYLGLVANSAALFLVNGNHEQAARYLLDGTPNNVAVWAQTARNLYFPQPAPDGFYTGNTENVPNIGLLRNYYAWEWGDALFVTIDPYWASPVPVDNVFGDDRGIAKTANKWEITHGDEQYAWLKRTLETSKAKWKFVFAHHVIGTGRGGVEVAPYFEWGGKNQNGSTGFSANRPSWEQPIHQLMVANHVTIFFQGHDHLFVRQQLDGVTYQELPEPADPSYTLWNSDAYESGDKFSNTGYVRVNVSQEKVKVEYVRTYLPKDEKPPSQTNGMVQFQYTIPPTAPPSVPDGASATLPVSAGGAVTSTTQGSSPNLQAGYAMANVNSGNAPYAIGVFSVTQQGVVVSEAGVPAAPPTTAARLFVDYESGAPSGPSRLGAAPVDINTGVAVVNPGLLAATVTYTLRDTQGRTVVTGHGTLAAGAHRARFLDQLQELAPDFVLPPDFPATTRRGSLEVVSDQPLSITALRMTVNQRGNALFTTVPIADLTQAPSTSTVFFPQVVDGDGYVSTFALLNTTSTSETGTLRLFADDGTALTLGQAGGSSGSSFRYTIAAGGTLIFQTDGAPITAKVGALQLVPDSGATAPVGAGIFSRTVNAILVTESGVPAAVPTTHARVYVDRANGHDSGLAIANTTTSSASLTLNAYQVDGSTLVGSQIRPLVLAGNGHAAAFASEWINGLPANFKGVLDIFSSSPFAALTLRSLTNSRGDFLLTTFPVADLNRAAPSPLVFPQVADGAGYRTEIVLISAGGGASSTVTFYGDTGTPLPLLPTATGPAFTLQSPVTTEGGTLPAEYTCDGTGSTLPLSWSNAPAGTREFAVLMTTLPGDNTTKWNWVLYGIPATATGLSKDTFGVGTLGVGSDGPGTVYNPPCSQGPGAKIYTYRVYALSQSPVFAVPAGQVTGALVTTALSGITLGTATLNVSYTRTTQSGSSTGCSYIRSSAQASKSGNAVVGCDADFAYIGSTGITTDAMMDGITSTNLQVPIPQNFLGTNAWKIPLNPVIAPTPTNVVDGPIGVAINGVPIFNPCTQGGCVTGGDTKALGQLDTCNGHAGRADDYHYHAAPTCLMADQSARYWDTHPLGWALDGFAIFGYNDASGGVAARDTICGGNTNNVPNAPAGYSYHVTDTAPYVMNCLIGVPSPDLANQARKYKPMRQPPVTPFRVSGMTLTTDPTDGYQVLQFTSAVRFNTTETGADSYSNAPGTYKIRYKAVTGDALTALLALRQNAGAVACWNFQFVDSSGATTQPTVSYCR